jgi:SAM-dependent methyltransferase
VSRQLIRGSLRIVRHVRGPQDVIRACIHAVNLTLSLRTLPPPVSLFFLRAHRHAQRTNDRFSLDSAIRPRELSTLLRLARGRTSVVELGTGTAWSTIALALGDRSRRVVTYDPCTRPERETYLELVGPNVRERIDFRDELDTNGPRDDESVDLLFVDSSHDRESVRSAFDAWRDSLLPGAVVAFHDYDHPSFPGVREAIEDLGLPGDRHGGLFAWRAPL